MNKKYYLYIGLILSLLLFGCEKAENNQADLSERNIVGQETETEIKSEILEGPKELVSEFMVRYFTIHMKERPVMIFEMKEKQSTSFSYVISRMQDDYTWKSEKLDWNNAKIKKKSLSLLSVAMNERNEIWGVFASSQALQKGKTNTTLIKLFSDGKSEEVQMKSASDKGLLQNIIFASNNKLVLQYFIIESLSNDEDRNSPYDTVVYDTVNEKILLEDNSVGFLGQNIDENLVICDVDSENKCVTGKKIGEKISEFALKCENELPTSYSIVKKDDTIYYMLDAGLYGGKVTEKNVKKIISSEKMILPNKTNLSEELKQYSDSITNDMAIASIYKVPGEDKEFLCLTKKGYDTQAAQWVHYYE